MATVPVVVETPPHKETREFYKTSEFWLMLLGQLVLTLQDAGALNVTAEKYNWLSPVLQAVLAGAYIISRGQAKSGVTAPIMPVPTGIEEFTQPDNLGESGEVLKKVTPAK